MAGKNFKNLNIINNFFLIFIFTTFCFLFLELLEITNWGLIFKITVANAQIEAINLLKNFKIPLFSFNQGLGFPILAESQSSIFDLKILIVNLLFSQIESINILIILNIFIFSTSIYYLLHHIYVLDKSISLSLSILCIFSPVIIGDFVHQVFFNSFVYLPLLLILTQKYLIVNQSIKFFLFYPIVLLTFLNVGHFQWQMIMLIYLTIYTLLTAILFHKNIIKIFLLFLISNFIGFGLGSFQLLPTLELMNLTERINFEHTFTGSLSYSAIALFYVPISKIFHGQSGSLGTVGFISIFIYGYFKIFVQKISFKNLSDKEKYFYVFVGVTLLIYFLSLGKNFYFNNLIYELPFFSNFRFPQRWMVVNSFSTIVLSVFSISYIKENFNQIKEKIKFSHLMIIIFLFFAVFIYHYESITERYQSEPIKIIYFFYPIVIIIFYYTFLKNCKKNFFFIFILTLIFFELIQLNLLHSQYSLFFNKNDLFKGIDKGKKLCDEHSSDSIQIFGDFNETEEGFLIDYKNHDYNSLLSSKNCFIFYHNRRDDVTSKGLGYNPSSLATLKMKKLSDYQNQYIKSKFNNFENNKDYFISSFFKNFTRNPVYYLEDNKLKKPESLFSEDEIKSFILGYQNENGPNFNQNSYLIKMINKYNLINIFPSTTLNSFRLIDIDSDQYFIPLWQHGEFFIQNHNEDLKKLRNFSFGFLIEKNTPNQKVYYVSTQFIIGAISSFVFLAVYFLILFIFVFRRPTKVNI